MFDARGKGAIVHSVGKVRAAGHTLCKQQLNLGEAPRLSFNDQVIQLEGAQSIVYREDIYWGFETRQQLDFDRPADRDLAPTTRGVTTAWLSLWRLPAPAHT